MPLKIKNREFVEGTLALLFFVALIAVGAILVSSEGLRAKIDGAGFWAPFLFVLLKISTVVITPLGGSPIYLTAESLFGFQKGYLLVVIGDIIGYSINFWLGRIFGLAVLSKILSSDQYEWVQGRANKIDSLKRLIVTLVVLAPVADALAYAIGMSKIKFRTYVGGIFICAIAYGFLMISFGSALVKDAQTYVLAIIILLIFSILLVRATQKWRSY